MVFLVSEIIDMIIMSLATGFIFMDMFQRPSSSDDPVAAYISQVSFQDKFLYAVSLVAPAIILHELGHKFVAMGFGLTATFQAAYTFLAVGVILKLLRFPFLIIVPAYVATIGATTFQMGWIAVAGPAVNALLWVFGKYMVRQKNNVQFWMYFAYLNGFLAIFNMLPIPGFDGFKVFGSLLGF